MTEKKCAAVKDVNLRRFSEIYIPPRKLSVNSAVAVLQNAPE